MSNTRIIVFSILIPPLGLLFVWTKTKWETGTKILVTALLGFYALLWLTFVGKFLTRFFSTVSSSLVDELAQ